MLFSWDRFGTLRVACLAFAAFVGGGCGFSGDVLRSLRSEESTPEATASQTELRHVALYVAAVNRGDPLELYYASVIDGQPQSGGKVSHALEEDTELGAFATSPDGRFVVYSIRRLGEPGETTAGAEDAAVYVVDFRDDIPKGPFPVPGTSGLSVRGDSEILRAWSTDHRMHLRLVATDEAAAGPGAGEDLFIVVDALRLVEGEGFDAVLETRFLERDPDATSFEIRAAWSPNENWLSLRSVQADGNYRTELASLSDGMLSTVETYNDARAGVLELSPDAENATLQDTNTGWSSDGAYFAMTELPTASRAQASVRVLEVGNREVTAEYDLDDIDIVDPGRTPVPVWSGDGHHLLYEVNADGQQYIVSMPEGRTGTVRRTLLNRGPLAGQPILRSRWIPGTALLLITTEEGSTGEDRSPPVRYLFDAENPDQEPVLQLFQDEDGADIEGVAGTSAFAYNGSWEAYASSSNIDDPFVYLANPTSEQLSFQRVQVGIITSSPFVPFYESFLKRPQQDFFSDDGALFTFAYGSFPSVEELYYLRCADSDCGPAQRIFPYSNVSADRAVGFAYSPDERYALIGSTEDEVAITGGISIYVLDLENDAPTQALLIDPDVPAYQGSISQVGWVVRRVAKDDAR